MGPAACAVMAPCAGRRCTDGLVALSDERGREERDRARETQ